MKKRIKWVGSLFNPDDTGNSIDTDNCADIVFINKGTAQVIVGDTLLDTNDSFTDPCFGDEVNKSNYSVTFIGVGTQVLYIRKKYYL
jgi:hypothetical protein